ncbi:hypothetical protein BJX76DRAFT_162903 [Aspergillus varians]
MPQGLKALKNRLLPRRKRPQPDQTDTPPGPASPTPASPSVSQLNIADAQDASIPQDLWQDAYNQLDLSEQHILSTVPVPTQLGSKNGGGSTIETILEGVIQTTKEQYERYQNRSFKIRRSTGEDIDLRKLSHKIIDAALSFKNIIDAVVASDPTHHAASAWAVVSLGLTMTKNHFDMQDALFDSSEYLANALARYACIEKQVYPNSTKKAEIRDAIVKVYTAILRYTAEASSAQISSAKRHILNSVVVIAGQPLEKLKKSVEAEELRLHQWIQLDHLLQHREKAESILAKIDEAFACLQSLVKTFSLPIAKGASYDSYMDQHESLCLPETRVELQGQISKWAESPHSKCIFWLNGMAGTGKSTIARTVAHAFDMRGQLGASFFFKKGEADRGNAERFISTITKQLIARNQQLANEVFKVIKKDADIATRSLKLQFDKLILQPLLNLDPHPQQATVLLIVIDALDECEQEKEIQNILQLLPQLQEAKSVRLQVFLTSRPELPIRLGFQQIMDHQDLVLHDLPHSVIEHDIRVFLKVELEKIRKDRLPSSDWPGNDAIDKLVIMAFPLFIFASTVCRFIGDRKWRPEKRLAAVLQDKAAGSMSEMDRTYLPVLTHLLAGDNESMSKELVREFQDIIGVIILLATPLSVASLAQLIKQEEDDISNRLDAFHSVLSISDDIHTPVRILHLSFRDFLVNTTSEFRVDEKETHQKIASFCLRVMNSGLKHNICSFSSYGTQRIDIDHDVIAHHLPPDLQYACHYWVYHLQQSKDHASHVEVFTFLQDHFLHWLEAMSLMGLVSETVSMIDILQSKIGTRTNTEFSEFLHDARRFILQNVYMCNAFPLQLYCSGLAFSPMCSVTRKLFQKSQRRLHILPQVESSWSAELQTLEGHSDGVQSVVFSADGQMLASGSDDHTIKLWDTKTGSEIRTLEGHSSWVQSVVFSADGQDGQPVGPSFQISVDNDWVSFAGERILWLPVKYRPFSCSIIQNDTLCLGYANGRVSIMGFHAPVA